MNLSIIVPCHNLEHFITPLLVSLYLQNLSRYKVELIFICDNCSDSTKQIIEKFDFEDKYTKTILEVNVKSCGLARNEGLKIAQGEYIWFIDGDDWLIDNCAIKKVLRFIIPKKLPIIRFDYKDPGNFPHRGYFSMVWQYVYSKEILEGITFIAAQPHEDVDFQKKILKKLDNQDIFFLDENLYFSNYKRDGSNMQLHFANKKI